MLGEEQVSPQPVQFVEDCVKSTGACSSLSPRALVGTPACRHLDDSLARQKFGLLQRHNASIIDLEPLPVRTLDCNV